MDDRLSRRRVLSVLGLTAGAAVLWRQGVLRNGERPDVASETRFLLGTVVNLTVCGGEAGEAGAALAAAFLHIARLERALSRHRRDSEVSRLNTTGHVDNPGRPLLDVLALAGRVSAASGGAFDITIQPLLDEYERYRGQEALPPAHAVRLALDLVDYRSVGVSEARVRVERPGTAVTLDGIAKGYAVDQGAAVLTSRGYDHVLVEAGGDLHASGIPAPGRPWRIGVLAPRGKPGQVLSHLDLSNLAAATSGDYHQPYAADLSSHHILDPRTGYSPRELASATVTAPSAAVADALSTAVMVLGAREGLALVEAWPGADAMVVGKDLHISKTAGFPG